MKHFFDFSNLNKDHETFSKKNKTVKSKIKIENPKKTWTDEFNCFRSKTYSFEVED